MPTTKQPRSESSPALAGDSTSESPTKKARNATSLPPVGVSAATPSPFFAKFPREIRDNVYKHLWHDTKLSIAFAGMSLFILYDGGYRHYTPTYAGLPIWLLASRQTLREGLAELEVHGELVLEPSTSSPEALRTTPHPEDEGIDSGLLAQPPDSLSFADEQQHMLYLQEREAYNATRQRANALLVVRNFKTLSIHGVGGNTFVTEQIVDRAKYQYVNVTRFNGSHVRAIWTCLSALTADRERLPGIEKVVIEVAADENLREHALGVGPLFWIADLGKGLLKLDMRVEDELGVDRYAEADSWFKEFSVLAMGLLGEGCRVEKSSFLDQDMGVCVDMFKAGRK
ncbi:hypothetical protein CC78DRAFT_542551 [Lojkania enalia]|uniref:Uncharacterized protein n=1 Tax=Lojkania enalia TaxID=147567 RepID=A0A9P4KCY6_9PLEO|nr:hypothetical protein CC78DRAFT_542551 [Didymosphaeria enalia]